MEKEKTPSILEKDIALKALCVKSIRAASSASIEHLCKDIVTFFEKYKGHYKDNWMEFEKEYKFILVAESVQKEEPLILKEFGYIIGKVRKQPQRDFIDLWPERLKTEEAGKIFQRAIDAGMMEKSPTGLKWNDTKQLLAYFAMKMSDRFGLTTKLDKDGKITTSWKPFETIFGIKGLKLAKQNWMRLNTKFEPTGFEKVDVLF